VAQNGQTLNVNSSRLAVAGDSVGGNMAAAVALLIKERGDLKSISKFFSILLLF
jgi:acetyl esterase